MFRDEERVGRIQRVLSESDWGALVGSLPSKRSPTFRYWPVIGSAVAIFTREGAVIVLAPEDERELAEQGWADEVRTFEGGSLNRSENNFRERWRCAERSEGSTRLAAWKSPRV